MRNLVTPKTISIDLNPNKIQATLYVDEQRGTDGNPVSCKVNVEVDSLEHSIQKIIEQCLDVLDGK